MSTVAVVLVALVVVLTILVVWPPAWVPAFWRRWTRPVRRRLRPRHYDGFIERDP